MRFVIDEQLPMSLARWLSEQGHEAFHIFDLGLSSASDRVVIQAAGKLGAAIITKDRDFTSMKQGPDQPQIIWLRTGNETTSALINRFAVAFPDTLSLLQEGETLVEVR